jgi:hypothetical protein
MYNNRIYQYLDVVEKPGVALISEDELKEIKKLEIEIAEQTRNIKSIQTKIQMWEQNEILKRQATFYRITAQIFLLVSIIILLFK